MSRDTVSVTGGVQVLLVGCLILQTILEWCLLPWVISQGQTVVVQALAPGGDGLCFLLLGGS